MAGLVYKDLLLLRRWLWYYGLMLGLFALFVALGVLGPSVLPGLAMLFSYMLPLNTFSWDEAARWGAFAAASPACLRGIVDSKYALCLLCAGAGFVHFSSSSVREKLSRNVSRKYRTSGRS